MTLDSARRLSGWAAALFFAGVLLVLSAGATAAPHADAAEDWTEHGATLIPLLGGAVVLLAGTIISLVVWVFRREESALAKRIDQGFASVHERLDKGDDRFQEHGTRLTTIETRCNERHGPRAATG